MYFYSERDAELFFQQVEEFQSKYMPDRKKLFIIKQFADTERKSRDFRKYTWFEKKQAAAVAVGAAPSTAATSTTLLRVGEDKPQ